METTMLDDSRTPPGKLRVLYVIPGTEEGISMSFARRQALSVAACGVDVRSFFLRSRTAPLAIWKEARRLRREIHEHSPHLVHAHFGTMTAFVAAASTRRPLVITFHGSDLNPTPGYSRFREVLGHRLSHFAARRAAQIICVSTQLRERLPRFRDRVHVIPCGVDLERFRPLSQGECREKLGWSSDERVVLFNARNDPIGKRVDLAQAAAAYVKREIPAARLHVFHGHTHPDEMPLYYSAADALLMTSDYEGSPMVIKEALACNLPIVSVDVGDVVARLRGVSHSAVVARDPAALGRALVRILRSRCRSNGRDAVLELSEQAAASKLASIYRLVAGLGPAGDAARASRSPVPLAEPIYGRVA